VLSVGALEPALGAGLGVVVADAIPATPIPALTARAVAERPRAILFLRDIFCLLDLPSRDGGLGVSLTR
jgi:hypothetical protein